MKTNRGLMTLQQMLAMNVNIRIPNHSRHTHTLLSRLRRLLNLLLLSKHQSTASLRIHINRPRVHTLMIRINMRPTTTRQSHLANSSRHLLYKMRPQLRQLLLMQRLLHLNISRGSIAVLRLSTTQPTKKGGTQQDTA